MNNQIVKLNYHKNIETFFKKEERDKKEENFYVSGFIATTHLDTTNDKITKEALEKALEYIKKNEYFTVLFNHDLNRPIGKIVNIELKELPDNEYGLYVDILISKTEQEIIKKIEEGILNKFSIGSYAVIKQDENTNYNIIEDLKIFECSIVSVPANPKASFSNYYKKSLSEDELEEALLLFKEKEDEKKVKITINTKEVDFTPWSKVNKPKLKRILMQSGNKKAIKECFGIVRSFERMGDWKFPHHNLIKIDDNTYELVLSYTGLIAAYKALRGARSKPLITPEERKDLKKHLIRHFEYLVRIGEYEEVPESLKKYIDNADISLSEWVEINKLVIEDIKEENIDEFSYHLIKNFIKKFNDNYLNLLFDIHYSMEENMDKMKEVEVDKNVILEENENKAIENEELIKEVEIFEPEIEEENEEDNEEKYIEEQEESCENENPQEENKEEMMLTEDDLRVIIKTEIEAFINPIMEKLNQIIEMLSTKEVKQDKNIEKSINPKGIEEIENKNELDFDLEEVIYMPEYKNLSIKEQLQVLKIIADRGLSLIEKKNLIKNLLKK